MRPKMAQDAFKEAQDGPKSAEDRLKMATIALQESPNMPKSSVFHWCVCLKDLGVSSFPAFRRPSSSPKCSPTSFHNRWGNT